MNPTRRNVLKWGVGGTVLAAASIGLPAAARADSPVTPGGKPTDSWMSFLDPNLSLLGMTIPGTHDTCCTNPADGTEWSHTQNWGIPQQLNEGVRFVDIRCNGLQGTASEMGIYHSSYYQGIRLQDVLDQCKAFLAAQPTETIVMRLKNENAGGQALSDAEFQRRFNYYMDTLGYRGMFHMYGWPTLGQAAGKVVLLADFAFPASWNLIGWADSANWQFNVQDTYTGVSTGSKGGLITQQFDAAYSNPAPTTMYVNFLSLAPSIQDGLEFPKDLEQTLMDNSIYPYLRARTGQRARFGIVPMDFPDFHVNVLEMLIDKNFV
ncbi:1-phosphatidylinositol phosphodiesterase [Catenulispora sp. MAP12-49]|uniref:phosphatidylinositol-specific phospholipase C n=1 Tax=unclassified Catenulispora TaxID=414885 RepID=UPI003515FFE5